MAKLDDSIVSQVSIAESNKGSDKNYESKMSELLSGIEAREKQLMAKQKQFVT